MSEELVIVDAASSADLVVRRPPEAVLEEARKAARALTAILEAKPRKITFNGEQYLEFEDWQTVARFYGLTARVTKTDFVSFGAVKGFSAAADILRSDGQVISSAEAMCLDDEEKWRSRSKYEWRDGAKGRERIKIGEEPVPLFQLKSMAQTRACAKAFRNVLAWVVVLAGYRPTPAEELDSQTDGKGDRHEAQAGAGSTAAAAAASAPDPAGLTKVKSVAIKTGGGGDTGKREWTRYDVIFEDGRKGNTFSKTDGEHAQRAQASGALVKPLIEKTEKGHNLTGFAPLEEKPKTPEHEQPHHEDDPVSGPEQVLTVRRANTDAGPRWIIQTSKRQLVTGEEQHATMALEARQNKIGLIPKFEVMTSPDGSKKVNRLLSFAFASTPPPPAKEPVETPGFEDDGSRRPKAAKGGKAKAAKRTREIGEEG